MPKYICIKCSHEFWGWGVAHQFRRGDVIACPDCDGSLVEEREAPAPVKRGGRLFEGAADGEGMGLDGACLKGAAVHGFRVTVPFLPRTNNFKK